MEESIAEKRERLEQEERQSHRQWENVRAQLSMLREGCKHGNAIVEPGYQGGGIYYCRGNCPDCGRSGTMFVPEYHMKMNNDWYREFPKHQITLEKAYEMGERIGKSWIESDRWWKGIDFKELLERSGMGQYIS